MSGGAFRYLENQEICDLFSFEADPWDDDGANEGELNVVYACRRTAEFCVEHGCPKTAARVSVFGQNIRDAIELAGKHRGELKEVLHAMEWYLSGDWGEEQVLKAVLEHEQSLEDVSVVACAMRERAEKILAIADRMESTAARHWRIDFANGSERDGCSTPFPSKAEAEAELARLREHEPGRLGPTATVKRAQPANIGDIGGTPDIGDLIDDMEEEVYDESGPGERVFSHWDQSMVSLRSPSSAARIHAVLRRETTVDAVVLFDEEQDDG